MTLRKRGLNKLFVEEKKELAALANKFLCMLQTKEALLKILI